MALAPTFLSEPELPHRMRIIAFSILTPFYFLKAGSVVEARAVSSAFGLIVIFLGIKMVTKFVGTLPLTVYHEFDGREGMYTTLLMSTGLTFGSISALFGLTNKIIDQGEYTILVTAVIGSAVVLLACNGFRLFNAGRDLLELRLKPSLCNQRRP